MGILKQLILSVSSCITLSLTLQLAFLKSANANVISTSGLSQAGVKYAEVCNTGSLRVRIITRAQSAQNRVNRVDVKLYGRYNFGFNAGGQAYGFASSEAWRNFMTINNFWYGDRVTYDTGARYYPLTTGIVDTPIKISTHIQTSWGTIYDAGGIIDFGYVPSGQCRSFGNL